ncbi:hypothetical protein GmHk_19G053844 [Glycine max]|nr:hypothetical protein GmHk_19G053844 [Glycine max]
MAAKRVSLAKPPCLYSLNKLGLSDSISLSPRQFSVLKFYSCAENILPERNASLYVTEYDEFRRELERRSWHKALTRKPEGHIDVALVKEFYANLFDPEDKSPRQELAARLCIPGRRFVLNAEGAPWKLLRKDLTTLALTWSVLSYSNLAPTSHTSDLNMDKARLVYGLVMKIDMDLGSIISGQISQMAQSYSSRLGFPALITALCIARGVVPDSLTFESLSPVINLAYIRKNCWNLDDPTITLPGTRKIRAQGPDASSSAPPASAPAPPIPTPAPPTPFGTSAQSTGAVVPILHSLHHGLCMVMQSIHDLA